MSLKKNLLLYFAILTVVAQGATVTDDVDYQLYRDFATNRGKFKVGNKDVVVPRKTGENYKLDFAIPDFSSTDGSGVGTLIDPSYVAGVKHNRGYIGVQYGQGAGHTYKLVDRNEHPDLDQHAPRLNKLVTDVVPSTIVKEPKAEDYSVFVRVGSGVQKTKDKDGKEYWIADAYQFLTGGVITAEQMEGWHWRVSDQGDFFNQIQGKSPFPSAVNPGDSGSPLWGLNKKTGKWELLGFATAITGRHSIYTPISSDFLKDKVDEDTLKEFETKGKAEIVWGATGDFKENEVRGTGTISQGQNKLVYNGLKSDATPDQIKIDDLNYGKHIIFSGEDGVIKLQDNINQGAGKIQFKGNYTVTSENKDKSWVGAGLQIEKDKKVVWQVKGVKDDDLYKIGEGTLYVNGVGVNEGGLNVGDGTVILDQQADKDGNKQAFSKIDIVSGRPVVVLKDANQMDTSNINFGYRGGRLDLNGNEVKFGDIEATDSGAMIINRDADKKAVATIDTAKFKGETSIYSGVFGETDTARKNQKLDVNIAGDGTDHKKFAVTGGANLNGNFNVNRENTTLSFSGERDLHAGENIAKTELNGDYDERNFKFNNINLGKNTEFQGGVYSRLEGNINTTEGNKVVLGYVKGQSEYTYDKKQGVWGKDVVNTTLDNDSQFGKITTYYKGNINLKNNSSLTAGYTDIQGNIDVKNKSDLNIENSIVRGGISTDSTSKINLSNTTWVATNSTINNLTLNNGTILLDTANNENTKAGTLSVDNKIADNNDVRVENLAGKGQAVFNIDFGKDNKSLSVGKIDEKGANLDLQVKNVGTESPYNKNITLLTVDNLKEKDKLGLTSDGKNYIDIGAVRGALIVGTDNNGKVSLQTGSSISKETASDLSNVSLSNFAARTSLIKEQKSILDDSIVNMSQDSFVPGVMYKGDYSDARYESDKFREYRQTTVNHGVGFEDVDTVNDEWNLYRGVAFIYGKSDIDYDGDYSGKMETYSGNVYGKLINKDGVYVKGITGVNYTKDKVNTDKFDSYSFTLGTGLGVEKNYSGFNIQAGTDLTLYYLDGAKYSLKNMKDDKVYNVENKDTYAVELSPQVRVGKDINFGDKKLAFYSGVGYDYNFYVNNDGAEVKVDGLSGRTGMIENGASIKAGTEFQYRNVAIGGEVKYLTGEDSSEKFTSTIKATIKF